MKSMKFPAGTFIEVDDMAGGRRVVMVCKDGVTFWDVMDPAVATPITLHPVMNPVELGSFVGFCKDNGLDVATQLLVKFLSVRADNRLNSDPLFVMRALWFISKHSTGSGFVPDERLLASACQEAELQEQGAARIHDLAGQYCSA